MKNLEKELAAFNKALPDLLIDSEGKYALVVGDEVADTFETYADAVAAGYRIAGLERTFLVKQVTRLEDVVCFARPVFVSPVLCQG